MPAVKNAVAAMGERVLRSRPLTRAPLLLYRAGLGAVLGSRMLMLEHVGRRSGATRQVVLEVVGRPGPGRYVVVSGFGDRAQWFRNVRAEPRVRVSVARHRSVPATAREVDPADARRILDGYVEANRGLWSWFGPVVERTLGRPLDDAAPPPPMVEFTLDPAR
jgi:deazaflavin-dependent oxidoreductase (nitroreductase family)